MDTHTLGITWDRHSQRKDQCPVSELTRTADVVLVGAGIMSATLAALLKRLEPDWSITVVERLDTVAAESSSPWNNAGTGHAALCELNYTPENFDGSINVSKAVRIAEQFQVTRQFWAYAVENAILGDVRSFLNPVPHVSFVHGADRVDYLRRRHAALASNPLFSAIELIDDPDEFVRRLPFMGAKRDFSEPVALNWASGGTDVDFGALSRQLIGFCVRNGATALFGHEVRQLSRQSDGSWTLTVTNRRAGQKHKLNAKFVFIGAGGDALPLLQKSGIREIKGFAGFPIGGRFLRTDNPVLTAAHRAKVYGVPSPGAPPLGALHLDLRFVNGKSWLVFGPYAGWSPKFLKQGHFSDLPRSIKPNNVLSMLGVGFTQMTLLNYLVSQLRLSAPDRVDALREFAPSAVDSDWNLLVAGQRVQVIRRDKRKGGVLDFGTTIVGDADGSIVGLLGGSPGASTAVPIMLEVLERCFAHRYQSWLPTLKEMVPSLGPGSRQSRRCTTKCGHGLPKHCNWISHDRSAAPCVGQGP
ncbi:putative malate:quinone oxidoreductase [Mycobacterium kansasii]|uniref:Probable malate:quinone oxidoreductase n=1 Tax=Mycobacterium kansasii TaxID=1768 RepID=A0A7G1IHG7_MYCKA|nr:putative malate:quinone oxidoreductase [Mycobacterium kansasii]